MRKNYKYDAFISYKRKGGTPWAELLCIVLEKIAGKSVYIDRYNIKGGDDWKKSIIDAISSSRNVIVPIFPGIQEVIKEKDDVFIEEIRLALGILNEHKSEFKIIPFYVDGLSSEILSIQSDYRQLPTELKTITTNKQGLKFSATNMDEWIKGLLDALEPSDSIRESYCYKVIVQSPHEEMIVYNEEDIDFKTGMIRKRQIAKGQVSTFWVEEINDSLVLCFEIKERIQYKLILDSWASVEKNDCCENEYEAKYYIQDSNRYWGTYCNIRKRGKMLIININWREVKSAQEVRSIQKHYSTNTELLQKEISPTVISMFEIQGANHQMDLFKLKDVK